MKAAQEVEAQLKEENSKKLELENCTLPEPFKLKTGKGRRGCVLANYTCHVHSKVLMINSDIINLSDYKPSKGYSYCKQDCLGKMSYCVIGLEHSFL